MHPGNIRVADDGRYIALDFGIMGTLTEVDKNYLAQNFLAFFNRDYRRVAQAHLEAGWVPPAARIDEFEAAIRAVCEPVFARPLKEIYFGKLLLRLFQTSRRFNVEVQPQLLMLQKTLLNIEGLGRELDPGLDLWRTAKPLLERWMGEQVGWRGLAHAAARGAVLGTDAAPAAAAHPPRVERGSPGRLAARAGAHRAAGRAAKPSARASRGRRPGRAAPCVWIARPPSSGTRFRSGVTPWDAGRAPPRLESWLAGKTPSESPRAGVRHELRGARSRAMATMCSASIFPMPPLKPRGATSDRNRPW